MTNITFNVAQLLREEIGARRDYDFTEDRLPLDDTLVLRDIVGTIRFTRTATGVFAHIRLRGLVQLVCVRSLELFDHPVELDISEEMHSVIDVMTGAPVAKPDDDDPFLLNELHMADVGEIIREYTLLALPLYPVCEAYRDTPVRYTVQSEDIADEVNEEIDQRLEVLRQWTERQKNQSDEV